MKTVAARMDLGMTRIAGYILFDLKSLEFHETTPREVERLVRQGQVNGLKFNENGEIIPDLEGWNLGNLKIKSAVGNYRNWNTGDPRGHTVYSVVRAIDILDVGRIYETINNRCGRVFYTGKQLAVLASMAWVGGIKVDDNDNITLYPGVQVEDWSDRGVYELDNQVLTKEQLHEKTMAELFGGETSECSSEHDAEHEKDTPNIQAMPEEEPREQDTEEVIEPYKETEQQHEEVQSVEQPEEIGQPTENISESIDTINQEPEQEQSETISKENESQQSGKGSNHRNHRRKR